MALMQGQSPWSFISSPSASPLQRASAVSDLGGGGGGIDLSSAFQLGSSAGGGGGGDMSAAMDDTGDDDGGLSSISPLLIAMTKKEMSGMGDDTPTSEDKGLALAQAGFATAAGDSPHALQNFGAGAVSGIQALQKAKQARALQRMKEAQMMQSGALRQAALVDAAQQKAAALKQAKAIADEKAQEARDKLKQDKLIADDKLAELNRAAGDHAQATSDRATGLAETRYNTAANARLLAYNSTGVWRKITGDEEHGVTGAPEGDTYTGPQVGDPSIPLKDRNKFKVEQPKQEQAVHSLDLTFGNLQRNAKELLTHPGLEGAIGFRMGQEFIPGSDAATFKAKLKALKSQIFAQTIQAMRDASKTGGAVGNVSDTEGMRFESMLGALDQAQDEETFKKALGDIIQYSSDLKSTYHTAYSKRYGDLEAGPADRAAKPLSIQDRLNKYAKQ